MSLSRNPYEEDVDFRSLALIDADFSKVLKSNGQLDFTDPASVKQLTKSLLKRDFGLTVDLPDDRLCPPVPNRLNYVLWIQDLVDSTSATFKDSYDEERDIIGLDIGTGASCIYPLLGCARRPRWQFAATDIDPQNLQFAQKNIQLNKFQGRIKVVRNTLDDPLIPLDRINVERLDFTMCNPPFYGSAEEMASLTKAKAKPPNSACTGAKVEMVTEGGEVAFVRRMIDESVHLQGRVQWYSSMLGRLSSLEELIPLLQARGVRNWAVTEFVQGTKTRRWALAWSWTGMRPRSSLARSVGALSKSLMPFPPDYKIVLPSKALSDTETQLTDLLGGLDLRWRYKKSIRQGIGLADGNVWSRAARRGKGGRMEIDDAGPQNQQPDREPALGFKLALISDETPRVEIRWLVGLDHVLFESFCGMLRRALTS